MMALPSSLNSFCDALIESELLEPLPACTARSRMCCSMLSTSVRAPSAVCMTLMPSWALRLACLRPPTRERRFSLMTRPAASSPARLIR